MLLNQTLAFTIHGIRKLYKKKKIKISAPRWNEKNHETVSDNPLIRTYINEVKNRIKFKIEKYIILNS